ncbi:Hypothetical protein UVM_LOCUS102 [uncultured virus]|nr:Hypothetical protein UVM_LOCUS102 [uncultured virus]
MGNTSSLFHPLPTADALIALVEKAVNEALTGNPFNNVVAVRLSFSFERSGEVDRDRALRELEQALRRALKLRGCFCEFDSDVVFVSVPVTLPSAPERGRQDDELHKA